jgi:hypothetical protein
MAQLAEVCGVHVGTILKWARRAQSDSVDTVIKGGQLGHRHSSGRTVKLVQEEKLRLKIIGSNRAQLQLEFALWNRRAVMLAIKQFFGFDMPIRSVGEYLLALGLHTAAAGQGCARAGSGPAQGVARGRVPEDRRARQD